MSLTLDELRSKRATILGQMQQIDHLRRGTLSQQFFKKRQNGQVVESGPYFVLQCFFKGKKCSERIPAAQAEEVQQQVENYRRFQQLAEEYVALSDRITQQESDSSPGKKNFINLSSTTNSSRKPKGS